MGQLVFQATLGGAVNLIGPNTASTINFTLPSADGTSGQALATNGTGTLAFSSFATLVSNTFTGSQTLSAGTANGVTYLNGSKVLTSGSALQFNGSQFGVNTTPSQAIDVVTDGASSIIRSTAYRASDGQAGINLRFARGSVASPTIVLTGDTIGTMEFYPYNGTNFNLQTALISAKVTGTVTTSNIPTALVFGLDAAGAAYSNEQMRLTSTGLVVGATSATAKLTVINTSDANKQIVFSNNASYYGSVGHNAGNGLNEYRTEPSGGHGFFIGTSSTANVTIDSSGSLLVGTTTDPTAGALARGIVSIKQLNDTSQTSGLQIEANANTNVLGLGYNGSTFAIGSTYRSTGSYVPVSFWTGGSERARITAAGELLVGATSQITSGLFCVAANLNSYNPIVLKNTTTQGEGQNFVYFVNSSGDKAGAITHSGTTSVSYVTSSDYRLKNTITPMTGALARVAQLKPVTYKWNADGSDGEGFIAHELAEVCPQAVVGQKDAVDDEGNPVYQGIDTSFLVATLTAAIQELKAEFDAYKASHP